MQNVQDLTLDTGVAESRDIELWIAMVDDYLRRGQFLDAVFMWITVGDRAALETTSFRERYELTTRSFGTRLASLFRDANIDRRADLIDNMLSLMEKPEGLYL